MSDTTYHFLGEEKLVELVGTSFKTALEGAGIRFAHQTVTVEHQSGAMRDAPA